jgi:two-component system chemotaxis response regulator CheB
MANRNIVAIGASAGGVEALLFLVKAFPHSFPATILITIHLPSNFRSLLDRILSDAGPLPASFAQDEELAKKGRIYIAPPGSHLLIDGDQLILGTGPRENNARPAIDPMLRSAAVCCANRAIGVVLTGTQSDGASGLLALSRCGGTTVVQDPEDAAFPEMPVAALNRGRPYHVVALAQMPALLCRLVHQPAGEPLLVPEQIRFEVDVARNGHAGMSDMDRFGRRSVLSCPDCGGVMWEFDDDDLIRYRCHVGHAYVAELMSLAVDENLRHALASAERGYEERIALFDQMQRRAVSNSNHVLAETWRRKAQEYRQEAKVIHSAIQRLDRLAAQSNKM